MHTQGTPDPAPVDHETATHVLPGDLAELNRLAQAASLAAAQAEAARLALQSAQSQVHATYAIGRLGGGGSFDGQTGLITRVARRSFTVAPDPPAPSNGKLPDDADELARPVFRDGAAAS